MLDRNRFKHFALFLFAGLTFVACGSTESQGCDPAVDEGCVCTLDDSGLTTDDCIEGETGDGEACTCAIEGNNNVNNINNDVNNDTPNNGPVFQLVLLEDLTARFSGDFPGAEIDAIGLIKSDGSGEVFASSVEEYSDVDCTDNLACDTSALLGAPDAVDGGICFGGGQPNGSLFTALNKGFVIVGFGDNVIENGDSIHVYEIGVTECGRFDNQMFSISVLNRSRHDHPIEVCHAGDGNNICRVAGL